MFAEPAVLNLNILIWVLNTIRWISAFYIGFHPGIALA